MDLSLIRRLVVSHLRPFSQAGARLQLFGPAGDVAAEAAAASGFGLDLYSGERVLASLLVTEDARIAVAFTNHRTIVGGAHVGFAVRHDEVTGIDVAGGKFELLTTSGRQDLSFAHAVCESIEDFYASLASADATIRVEPPSPTFAPDGADPTGAKGALAQLWGNDPEAAGMLTEIVRRSRSGDLEIGAGQDLVGRVVLAHRARSCGPAAFGPHYLSPLPAEDFGRLLRTLLGSPSAQRSPNPGVARVEFDVEGTRVGVTFREVSGGCCFQLMTDGHARLEVRDPELAHRVHQRLILGAYTCLDRTCADQPTMSAAV